MHRVLSFSNARALVEAAAADWLELLAKADGRHLTALAGGRIAGDFFDAVVRLAPARGTPFANTLFFWGDERCVPPEDAESNYRLANERLLMPLHIAANQIHRLKGELLPAAAVAEANTDIRALAPMRGDGMPILDLVFLGMGENGHTASLMPNAPAAVEQSREPYVHVPDSPKPPPHRLSLTYPMLAAAREVWVLVSGADKKEPLRETLRPGGKTPLARVLREREQTRIYTDLV